MNELELRNLAIDAFGSAAKDSYDSGSKIEGRTSEVRGIEAESYRWPGYGITRASERIPGAEVVNNAPKTFKPRSEISTFGDYSLVPQEEIKATNVDDYRARGRAHGQALGRKKDEEYIRAIKTWNPAAITRKGLVATDMVIDISSQTARTTAKLTDSKDGQIDAAVLRRAVRMLIQEGVANDSWDCTLLAPGEQFEYMAGDEYFSSMDYLEQGVGRENVTRTGKFGSELYGCRPIFFDDNVRADGQGGGGGDLEGNAYVFAYNSVGMAYGTLSNYKVMDWIPIRRSTLMGAEDSFGAARRDNSGIVTIKLKA